MKSIKIIVEKHPDVYIAHPLGLKGVVIGQGDTYEAALLEKHCLEKTRKLKKGLMQDLLTGKIRVKEDVHDC